MNSHQRRLRKRLYRRESKALHLFLEGETTHPEVRWLASRRGPLVNPERMMDTPTQPGFLNVFLNWR